MRHAEVVDNDPAGAHVQDDAAVAATFAAAARGSGSIASAVRKASAIVISRLSPMARGCSGGIEANAAPSAAGCALPLVLPLSVLGFYLLIAMGPNGPVGHVTQTLGLGLLPFTFWGLVVASVFYSLPFMVQPLQTAFEAIGDRPLEVAATLRASPFDAFLTVAVPLALPGFLTASILTFTHTVGEFGVVLMIGGNLAGITRVASVQIYDHVEALEYSEAHRLAAVMLIFSFLVLLAVYAWRPSLKKGI